MAGLRATENELRESAWKKKKKLKFGKWFMVLKKENNFTKIKEDFFRSTENIFGLTTIFCMYQILKNR
jgi:hypothetical protein